MPNAGDIIPKDPDAVLNYTMDWSGWLDTGETISASDWVIQTGSGLSEDAASETDTTATVTLSGGNEGGPYRVTSRITTSAGQVEDRSFFVVVKER